MLNNRQGIRRVAIWLAILAVAGLVGTAALGQGATTEQPVQVTRRLSTGYVLPEGRYVVTLRVEVSQDLSGVGIREVLPRGWTIHPLDNAGAAFKRAEGEWVFEETLKAGAKREITYEVSVPSAASLLTDFLPSCVSFSGTVQAKAPSLELPITGDSSVEVAFALPIPSAIAHLVPQSSEAPDTIDLRLSKSITKTQFARALELWRQDAPVPETGGRLIDLDAMEGLVARYETCTPADQPLPQSEDPKLSAVRTISTFLPDDSVLLPQGCLDPGLNARRFTVTLDITAEGDVYGVGLKEWLPEGWRVVPVDNDGFWYRVSQREWIYPKRLAAGESVRLVYQAEVFPSAADRLASSDGCCGRYATLAGTVSSALECSERDTTGEKTIHVWDCLPVVLAISRWDAGSDTLDVSLSDTISFLQVQRAVAFWSEEEPVPYTCGYTVGYETLKTIIAHWLTHTPVTEGLPDAPAQPCATLATGCSTPPDTSDWFCQMKLAQPPSDRVGVTPSEPPIVDAGPDVTLTCSIQMITLAASVKGGAAPYSYQWLDSVGQVVGTSPSITVSTPGSYTAIVTACGGCRGADTVIVKQDIAAPNVMATADGILTCANPSVQLSAAVSGGTGPFSMAWTDAAGKVLGTAASLSVETPGTYTVTVTGANGCSGSDTVVVGQDIAAPSVTARADGILTCANQRVGLMASVSGGRPPFTTTWTDAAGKVLGTAASLSVETPGTYTVTVTGANGCRGSDTVVVGQDIAAPSVTASADGTLSCANSTVQLSVAVNGGRSPFTYAWTDAAGKVVGASASLSVETPGRYTVTVTGANGCSGSDTVTVGQDIAAPSVTASADGMLTCANQRVGLTTSVSGGTGPFSMAWTDAAGKVVGASASLSVETPGRYTVTVTGANGCSGSDTVTVGQDIAAPSVTAGADGTLTCFNTDVQLSAAVSGGRSPFAYTWTNAAGKALGTSASLSVETPGPYTVTVTGANGCSGSDTVVVGQDVAAPNVTATADGTLTCFNTHVQLSAAVSGGRSPFTYSWTDASGKTVGTSASLSVDQPGTYTVTVTGANGCTGSDTVEVGQDIAAPSVAAGADGILTCANSDVGLTSTVSGGRSPFTYEWSDPAGKVVGASAELTVSAPGTYTVTVTGANGCSGTDTVEVRQDMATPSVTASADGILTCADPDVRLSVAVSGGRPPFVYAWTDGAGRTIGAVASLTVGAPGTYTVTVTGANGCRGSDTVTVGQDVAAPSVTAGADGMLTCANPDVQLSAAVSGGRSPLTIAWTDAAGKIVGASASLSVETPGRYTVTVTGANGCSGSDTVVVGQDVAAPSVTASADGMLTCTNPDVQLSVAVSGGRSPFTTTWTDTAGKTVGTSASLSVDEPGTYTVTVTGANGCSGSDTVTVGQDVAAPSVKASVDGTLTCANRTVQLSAAVNGGRSPFTYEWADPAGKTVGASASLSVDQPGTYAVTVTGANGCRGSDIVTVGQDVAAPSVTASADGMLTCANPDVQLSVAASGGTGPFTTAWTDAAGKTLGTATKLTVGVPGTYTVTVTGENGCSGSDTVEVGQDIAAPSVTASVDGMLTCANSDVHLSAAVSGGRPPFTTTWTDAAGKTVGASASVSVDQPGTYAVTVTGANGCSASDTVTVGRDVAAPNVTASADGVLTCANPDVQLSVAVNGGTGPFTPVWTDAAGKTVGASASVSVDQPGTYTVTVTGANGCRGSDTVVVGQDIAAPSVTASADGLLTCANTDVQLSTAVSGGRSPFNYAWTNAAGKALGTSASLSVDQPGTYTVTVTGANGCTGSDTVEVRQDIAAPSVTASADGTLTCANTSVQVDVAVSGGTGPFSTAWTDAAGKTLGTATQLTIGVPGTYTVTVTGANGCSGSDTVTVGQDIAAPSVTASADGTLTCANPDVQLSVAVSGGTGPFTTVWADASGKTLGTSASQSVKTPGMYTVTVTGANGCTASDAVTVGQDIAAPSVTVSADGTLTCANPDVQLSAVVSGGTGPFSTTWTNAADKVLGTAAQVTISAPGTYTATVTGANGCSDSGQITVSEDTTAPEVDAGPDQELTCAHSQVVVDATVDGGSPPYTYSWMNECGEQIALTEDTTVVRAGVYMLTVTGANGCSATDSVRVINKIDPPAVDAGPDCVLRCDAPSVLLDATVSGGAAPYAYEWTDACGTVVGTTEDVTVALPGIYTLTAKTADGCIASDSVEVTEEADGAPATL